MNSNIKAVFFDVDGTLYSHSLNAVPDSARRALQQLRERGVKAIVATGRHMVEYSTLPVNDIDFDAYLTLNGQLILDSDRKAYTGTCIDPGEMEVLSRIFQAKRIPFMLVGENERYINYVDNTVIRTQAETMAAIPDVGEYKGEKVYQILAFVPEKQKKLLDDLLDECSVTSWNETGIDIIPKGGGKAVGIEKYIRERFDGKIDGAIGGDGENDIDMLQFAGVGVAMGNADEKVKAMADYVTDTVENDGIEKALRHFGLID